MSRALWPTARTTWSAARCSAAGEDQSPHLSLLDDEVLDPAPEADLAAQGLDLRPHGLHHLHQPEGADVGLVDEQDLGRRAGLDEFGEHLAPAVPRVLDLAVELAVGKGAGAAFAELHVGFRIENPLAPEPEGVDGALADLLAALQDDRAESHLRQQQAREEAAGPHADHHRPHRQIPRRLGYEAIGGVRRRPDMRVAAKPPEDLLLAGRLDVEMVDERDRTLFAGIEAAPEDRIADQLPRLDAELFEDGGP